MNLSRGLSRGQSRGLSAVAGLALATALAGCGSGLGSSDPDSLVASWSDAVCRGDVRPDEGKVPDGAGTHVVCTTDTSGSQASEGRLYVFADTADAKAMAADEKSDCDVPYSVVRGDHWVSLLDDGYGAQKLTKAGATLVCRGA